MLSRDFFNEKQSGLYDGIERLAVDDSAYSPAEAQVAADPDAIALVPILRPSTRARCSIHVIWRRVLLRTCLPSLIVRTMTYWPSAAPDGT
jgi:hypothetical protein